MPVAHSMDIHWGGGGAQDRRYRRIALLTLAACLVLSLVLTFLPIRKPERLPYQPVPERIARLVIEARKPAPPPPPPPRVEEPEPEPEPVQAETRPEPSPEPESEPAPRPEPTPRRSAARERAERAGVMAFKDVFADLRNTPTVSKLSESTRLSTSGTKARKSERSILTAGLARGSGGVDSSGLSRDTGATELASRSTSRVEQPASERATAEPSGREARVGNRSDEEIELIFDRNKSVIYNIYNRALRSNPALRGKVVFRLTIDPAGKVTQVDVVNSELGDSSLERKLVLRIKRFDFGARQVAETTIRYTIDFFPS